MPDFGSLASVAAIVAATLALVEVVKAWPVLDNIPTKALALLIGAALSAYAYYTGQISGNLGWIVVQVVLGVFGAPGFWQLFQQRAPAR